MQIRYFQFYIYILHYITPVYKNSLPARRELLLPNSDFFEGAKFENRNGYFCWTIEVFLSYIMYFQPQVFIILRHIP